MSKKYGYINTRNRARQKRERPASVGFNRMWSLGSPLLLSNCVFIVVWRSFTRHHFYFKLFLEGPLRNHKIMANCARKPSGMQRKWNVGRCREKLLRYTFFHTFLFLHIHFCYFYVHKNFFSIFPTILFSWIW